MLKYMRIFSILLLTIFVSVSSFAQQTQHLDRSIKQFENEKLESRRVYVGDIPSRVTKVVLSKDNSFPDLLFKNAVEKGWYLTPFEYCTYAEFEKIKCDTNYYFLLRIDKMDKKGEDPSMEFITYVKGGPKAEEGIGKMTELISLPIYPGEDKNGRIFSYLPTYMNIIQEYLQNVSEGEITPKFNNDPYCYPMEKAVDKEILFVKEDVLYELSDEDLGKLFKGHAKYTTQEDIDEAISQERQNTLVSLVVVASDATAGSYCYKMLISTDTYQLFFYRKHKISRRLGAGFMKEDMRRISTPYIFGISKDE